MIKTLIWHNSSLSTTEVSNTKYIFCFTGTGFATCNIKESAADSDADLDVDGDDTLEYGKAQYTEADIIPCSGAGEDQGEAREREALRGAVLKYELTRTYAKWFILI